MSIYRLIKTIPLRNYLLIETCLLGHSWPKNIQGNISGLRECPASHRQDPIPAESGRVST